MKISRKFIVFQPSPRLTHCCLILISSPITLAGSNLNHTPSKRKMNSSKKNLLVNPSLRWWFLMNQTIQMKQYLEELSLKVRKRQSLSHNNVQKTRTITLLPMMALISKTTKKSKFIYSANYAMKICRTLQPREISLQAKEGPMKMTQSETTAWRFKQFVG